MSPMTLAAIWHINTAGLVGGFPLCNAKTGMVVVDETKSNCSNCRKIARQAYKRKNLKIPDWLE